jgi:hypothetical protein
MVRHLSGLGLEARSLRTEFGGEAGAESDADSGAAPAAPAAPAATEPAD